jgi:hypothetical protein
VRKVVILGRGGAGKSALSRQLSDVTGIPAVELDALFWQPGLAPMDPSRWAACQHELVQRSCWILDGDLGPYDTALAARLRAADTVVVLDFAFLRCAWRTLRRGREQAGYWRWVRAYRRRSLPGVMRAIPPWCSASQPRPGRPPRKNAAAGKRITLPDPARYSWAPVKPGDPDHMPPAQRLLHVVADRQRWHSALVNARARASGPPGPDLSATRRAA